MTIAVDLTGRVALVTGGARGVGRGITDRLGEAGASIVVCGRSTPEPGVLSADVVFLPADVRDPESVGRLVDGIVERFGRLDVAVNNAGGAPGTDAGTASPRFSEKVLALNLTTNLAMEWAPKVRVNAVSAGMVRTETFEDYYGGPDGAAAVAATVPLGRVAEPADIGNAVAWLASDLAAFVSGTNLVVHGGGERLAFFEHQHG